MTDMKEKIREILWNFVAGEVTDSEAVQQVLDLFAVMPSLPIERFDAEDFLITKGISNHPRIQDSVTGKQDYEVADLMAEFAMSFFRQ